MTGMDVDGMALFGRKVKPVAFGFAFVLTVYLAYGLTDSGTFDGTVVGDVVAIGSAGAVAMMLGGWWGRSQRMAEYGLLLTVFVILARTLFLLLSDGLSERALQGFGFVIIAAGSYWLERNESHRRAALAGGDA